LAARQTAPFWGYPKVPQVGSFLVTHFSQRKIDDAGYNAFDAWLYYRWVPLAKASANEVVAFEAAKYFQAARSPKVII